MTPEEFTAMNKDPILMQQYAISTQSEFDLTDLGPNYKKLKECRTVQELIMSLRILKSLLMDEMKRVGSSQHCLENSSKLSADFIVNADGDFVQMFKFSELSLKYMFISDLMKPEISIYLLKVLQLLYNKMTSIVNKVTTADIDTGRFSEMLLGSIGDLKKVIGGCDDAFSEISGSIDLLKGNFNNYYFDMVSSGSPSILMENFLLDVAQKNKQNPKTIVQYRKIVEFYRAQSRNRPPDPKAEKLFSLLAQNIDLAEGGKKGSVEPVEPTVETPGPNADLKQEVEDNKN